MLKRVMLISSLSLFAAPAFAVEPTSIAKSYHELAHGLLDSTAQCSSQAQEADVKAKADAKSLAEYWANYVTGLEHVGNTGK